MIRPTHRRTFACILLFAWLCSLPLMGSEAEHAKKKKKKAEATPTVTEQLKQLQNQLNQQQSQIKAQQDHIQTLEQQLQQSNSQMRQESTDTRQLQDQVRQANQKATSAQDSASAASATATEAKTQTAAVAQNLQSSQKALDKLINPEKYLPKPTVVQAVAPVRVLPVDPPKRGGLNPAFRIGGIRVTPYGFIKATAIQDSSSPNGDDFPFVGLFLSSTQPTNAGPNGSPEFHVKARSTRFGSNFEWPDMSKRLTLTGRIEGDFEGNFSEVDNRDVSSLRSSEPQLRLAFARLDYKASDKTDLFFKGGQDWTLFGSTAMANLFETTFFGAFYGNVYTRAPQFTFGVVQDLGGAEHFKFLSEVGIMMPSSGQILKLGSLGLAGQLGEGEREGADSDRPEWEGRAVLQFQLDKAKGVAPAQLIVSGFQGKRTSIVTQDSAVVQPTSAVPGVTLPTLTVPANYLAAFPNGFTASSQMYGGQVAVQLPTRFVTVTASAYRGGDLRYYFGGQVNSYATDMTGLTNPIAFTTLDGGPMTAAGMATLATNAAGQVVVAPQKPIRSFGGFVNVGFPLSRYFHADPAGHNAGWTFYLTAGKDQVVSRDLTNPGFVASIASPALGGALIAPPNSSSPLPLLMGKMGVATLYYKFNRWCQFGLEQSIYATRLAGGAQYTIGTLSNGQPRLSNEWQDHRTELGPVFTF